jgi:hypothetical protein
MQLNRFPTWQTTSVVCPQPFLASLSIVRSTNPHYASQLTVQGLLITEKNTMEPDNENQFRFESSIPVLRMLDEGKTKAFYLDYLGYQVEWEHRFDPQSNDSPLYMQIKKGDSVFHLNGHANRDSTVAEVRIPVHNLEAYCEWLRRKTTGTEKPEVVDPRYEGEKTDMNLYDPSGNFLVFWSAKKNSR